MVKIGNKIKVTSDNENYKDYKDKIWEVESIYSNNEENPLYDMGVFPQKLVECNGLPFALYELEFEIVE